MAKQTIIYVKCCADWFVCLDLFFIYCVCLISVCYFFHLCCATIYDGEIKLYIKQWSSRTCRSTAGGGGGGRRGFAAEIRRDSRYRSIQAAAAEAAAARHSDSTFRTSNHGFNCGGGDHPTGSQIRHLLYEIHYTSSSRSCASQLRSGTFLLGSAILHSLYLSTFFSMHNVS